MKSSFLLVALGLTSLFAIGCASNDRLEVGGVPEWIGSGAKISDEPEPRKPDNWVFPPDKKQGPVMWTYTTDGFNYPDPPKKKTSRSSSSDPIERGRNYRINRLFR